MPLTRREFLVSGLAGIGAAALPLWCRGLAQAAQIAAPLNFTTAFTQLGRLSYGPTLPQCTSLIQSGLATYLDSQLAPNDATDAICNAKLAAATLHIEYKGRDQTEEKKKREEARHGEKGLLAEILGDDKSDTKMPAETLHNYASVNEDRPLLNLDKSIEALWPLGDNDNYIDHKERRRPAEEVRVATWIRAVHSEFQLREVMVEFWHNHFNVNAYSDLKIMATFPLYDAVMRRNWSGNFRSMLEEVAMSPAMLYYLNNAKSHASPANENYARELFELHTLGADHYYNSYYNRWREVPGATEGKPIGYIDQDVYEAARAFTGWTIEDGTNTSRGTTFPKTGKFTYFDGWHDNYQKRVLGTEFDPNAAPMDDGKKVLDLVAYHPGTAMFLCSKLCRRLVSDNPPPELVKRAAAVWMKTQKSPDQIAQVLRSIILSPEFAAPSAIKIKRPFEYVVSFLRATGASVMPNDNLFNNLSGAGQRQFEWPTPTGHPDSADYWLNSNSTLSDWNLLQQLLNPNFKAATIDLAAQTPPQIRTAQEIVNYWFERLTGHAPSATMLPLLLALMPKADAADTPNLQNGNGQKSLQALVTTIAMLPDFAVRG